MITSSGKNFLYEPSNRRVFYLKNFLYICIMKNGLLLYFVYGVMGFMVAGISLEYLFLSVMEVDYLGVLIWSLLFSTTVDDIVTKQINFSKYYPNFQDKWLTFL